ncbi:hypothetical protein GDO78_019773 [Eleutherodactylus coqui]|uniref:Uncharacterized protein n=1 Tax=Eleutherodactylus coqui TaxID=57060 RepID=A0A8J6E7J6_ELECQ|nr:hypothetical protein GDO78_019773 [Eleutherodactylus coqui]
MLFVGSRLFGAKLDELISEATGGKSSLLPQNHPKRSSPQHRRFRSYRWTSPLRVERCPQELEQRKVPSFKPRSSWRGPQPTKGTEGKPPA